MARRRYGGFGCVGLLSESAREYWLVTV